MGQLQQSVVMIYNPNIIAALQFPGRARESAAVAAVGDGDDVWSVHLFGRPV